MAVRPQGQSYNLRARVMRRSRRRCRTVRGKARGGEAAP
jgi:hypothetical protein